MKTQGIESFHISFPRLIILRSPTPESSSAMQTSAAGNAAKRLMGRPFSKASTFLSHVAIAVWPSTEPGNSEDTCWSVTALLEGCVPCAGFSSLVVSFQCWLCFLLCWVRYSQILVYLANLSEGIRNKLVISPSAHSPHLQKKWLWYRAIVMVILQMFCSTLPIFPRPSSISPLCWERRILIWVCGIVF